MANFEQFGEAIDEFQAQGSTIVEDVRRGPPDTLAGSAPVRVTVGLPLSIYAATNKNLPMWARVGFGLVAGVTAVKEKRVIGAQLNKLKNFIGF